jgi:hypothetical protein
MRSLGQLARHAAQTVQAFRANQGVRKDYGGEGGKAGAGCNILWAQLLTLENSYGTAKLVHAVGSPPVNEMYGAAFTVRFLGANGGALTGEPVLASSAFQFVVGNPIPVVYRPAMVIGPIWYPAGWWLHGLLYNTSWGS